jgi:colicin import membrane protein
MSTAIAVGRYRVRNKRYTVRSFLLALLLHGGLVAWMWYAVQWHTSPAAPAVAELWEPTAEPTAPPPEPQPQPQPPAPPPPPPVAEQSPPKPDIVQQQEKPKKKAPEPPVQPQPKRDNTPKKPSAQEIKRQQAEAEKQHQEEIARLASQADSTPAPRSQAYASSGGADNSWVGKVIGAVKSHLFFAVPEGVTTDVYAEFHVELLPTGELASDPELTKSSGIPGYDDAARRAIMRTNPFPRRDDGSVPRSLTLQLHPQDAR